MSQGDSKPKGSLPSGDQVSLVHPQERKQQLADHRAALDAPMLQKDDLKDQLGPCRISSSHSRAFEAEPSIPLQQKQLVPFEPKSSDQASSLLFSPPHLIERPCHGTLPCSLFPMAQHDCYPPVHCTFKLKDLSGKHTHTYVHTEFQVTISAIQIK